MIREQMDPMEERLIHMQQIMNFHETRNKKFARLLDDLQIAVFKKKVVDVAKAPEEHVVQVKLS